MQPKEALQKYFGYSEFRPAQEEIINAILNRESVLSILPTGGGKSICYQLPALLSPNYSIVISPLIALMKDQVDSLNKRDIVSAFINSSLDFRDVEKVFRNLNGNLVKILYVSPEKLSNKAFAERLKTLSPSFVFVDEAHCISEWGHNFRPSYRKIKEFVEFINVKNVSAFTATATEEVRKDIIEQLGLVNPKVFIRGFERNNFYLNVIHTSNKKEKSAELLKGKNHSAIIYTATRKNAEEVSQFLRSGGIDSIFYHAGLAAELRRMIQDDFLSGRVKVIAATNAFGMGIDKSDIRTIIHYNLPGSIENYYQEIGRAGRDGKNSNIYLLYDERDRLIQEYFINSSYPTNEQVEIIYQLIYDHGRVALGNISEKDIPLDSTFNSILQTKKINQGILDSSIRILEESGYLRRQSDFGMLHFGKFLMEPNRINQFTKNFTDAELRDIVILLVRDYGTKIFNNRTEINIKNISEQLGISDDLVSDYLQNLHNAGIFMYESPLLSPSIKLLQPRIKSDLLKLNLENAKQLSERANAKLEKMINYTYTNECRFKFVLEYFGQNSGDYKCGKCDVCTGSVRTSRTTLEYLEEILIQTIHESKIPIKKKTVMQILTGDADLISLKKFSTFGTCTHFKKEEIERSILSLANNKWIVISNDVLALSEKSIESLLQVKVEDIVQPGNDAYEEELKLFNLLRQIRKEASEKFGQATKLICPDEILREIVRIKPLTHTELINIKGFTQRMFNKVGLEFLDAINDFQNKSSFSALLKKKNIPENIHTILELVQKKYSLEDISSITKLPESIVSTQIESLIELNPSIEVDHFFSKNELSSINEKIDKGITELKILREALENKISYAKLRIALAKKRTT